MAVFEVIFTRRLAANTSAWSLWLDEEGHEQFCAALEEALQTTGMRTPTMHVWDVFDIERFIQMLNWEQISITELKGERLNQAVDTITKYHMTTSDDGKVVNISRRHNEP